MAADMAVELKEQNVACVSLWPGAVMTENVNDFISQPQDEIVIFFIFMLLSSPLPFPPPPSSLLPPSPLPPPPSSSLLPPSSSSPCLSCICRTEKRSLMSEKFTFVTLWDWIMGGGILPYMGWKVMKKPYCQISAFKCKFSGRYKDLYALFTLYKSLWKWLGSNRLRSRPYLDEFFVGVIGA